MLRRMRRFACLLLLTLPACHRSAEAPADAAPPPASAAAPRAPERPIVRREAQLMGTRFAITVSGGPAGVDAVVQAAFDEVARVDKLMSEWRDDSEVTAINRDAATKPVAVSTETFEVVRRAMDLSARSNGAFDVTWAALRGLWDFKAKAPHLPDPAALKAALARTGWQKVKLDPVGHTIALAEPGMAIGLGGIAKGYGIDRAVAVLKEHGFTDFIVDGGGDLFVAGEKQPGVPWHVGVQHPRRKDQLLVSMPLRDAAIVTSGDYERFFVLDGKRYHHIIDLKTGMPADKSVAVTVRASDATLADAVATAIFVLGPDDGIALANGMPGVDAAVLAPDGRVVTSAGLAGLFPARWSDESGTASK
jgi:thiamine biosynthesis lipoprotein